MKTIIHKHDERGEGEYGWLTTHYSFSFADWYNKDKMGFGALRVLNDDIILPGYGFGMHGHKNMEIITIVMHGEVTHKDSMGNSYVVKAGDVQVMSAGTGVLHSEENASSVEPLELFQLWIEPRSYNVIPHYEQKSFMFQAVKNTIIPLVHEKVLAINQDAYIFYGALDAGASISYTFQTTQRGVYIFVVEGVVIIKGEILRRRDAVGLFAMATLDDVHIQAEEDANFLIIEVPMK
jgi:quercetin 2,3-dioxygenase